jgi:hypothetical protein
MQDPTVGQMLGKNPQAQRIMASLQAHIAEHLGFSYRKQIEERLGATLPAPNEKLPEDVEVTLSRLVAKAGVQLSQMNQKKQAQQQAMQKAQDPVIQMQQQELQIKQAEMQRKTAKDTAELEIKQAEQKRKTNKDKADMILDAKELELETAKANVDMSLDIQEAERNVNKDLMDIVNTESGKE